MWTTATRRLIGNGWRIVYAKQAQRDAKKLSSSGMRPKAEALLAILAEDLYRPPPPFEKLVGHLTGAYSRRINGRGASRSLRQHLKQVVAAVRVAVALVGWVRAGVEQAVLADEP